VGPTATVTTLAGQRLTGAAIFAIGLAAGTATQNINVDLCVQSIDAGNVMNFTGSLFTQPQITVVRTAFSPAASAFPGAGTWKVGACIRWIGTGNVANNDYVNGWVHVTN
jgi:hypothetical protein